MIPRFINPKLTYRIGLRIKFKIDFIKSNSKLDLQGSPDQFISDF